MNGTVEVAPKANVENLTLDYGQPKEYYEQKFQETANKYTDNRYAISARTVNSGDLDYIEYDNSYWSDQANDFWLNTINEKEIQTSREGKRYQYTGEENYKIYVLPYIEKTYDNVDGYNVGDIIEYSNNGVNRWIVAKVVKIDSWWGSRRSLVLIPERPTELVIDSIDDKMDEKAKQITDSFNNNNVYSYGNYFQDYQNDTNILTTLISDFLNQQTEKIYFYSRCTNKNFNKEFNGGCGLPGIFFYENGELNTIGKDNRIQFYTYIFPTTLGYRPVVTLKLENGISENEKKETSNNLQIGDIVKYEANGYKNWKVLSIDENLGIVDIISGGIVKNITLSGKEDWDNYEAIIQQEVNQYKNGSDVISASTVNSSQLKQLKEIDKSILSRYWILSKDIYIEKHKYINERYRDMLNYGITTIDLYKYKNNEMKLENIILYSVEENTGNGVNEGSSYSYTAGIRPVIRLKLNDVEKASDKETKIIVNETEKVEKIYIKEQETSNSNYNGPAITDEYTSINDTSNADINHNNTNKNEIKNSEKVKCTPKEKIVEKIVYNDKWFYKYGFFILLIPCIVEAILLIVRMKSKN